MQYEALPLITLILPCRNEELFIENCINSILENDYPADKIELLIIDGLSNDKTLDIAKKYINNDKGVKIKILENPGKFFPIAVNIGIVDSKGEYIFILGAHAVYDRKYFSGCIETAIRTKADNTGGILITDGLNKTFIGKAITFVLSNSFGVGNAKFRTGAVAEREADTVFGGCYKKEVFEKYGLFNENLISSSDMEFNVRLRRNGGKIILNPTVKATYYTRTDFLKFVRNNFRNGYWAIYPIKFVKYIPVSLRHLIPLFFFGGITLGLVLSFYSDFIKYLYLIILFIYIHLGVIFSLKYAKKNPLFVLIMPFLFFLLHYIYGLGSSFALIKLVRWRKT